jgi:hypothetical protein
MVCFFLFFDWGCFVSLLCLSQRAWLLKLLAVELHAGDVSSSNHRDTCQTILSNLFGQGTTGIDEDQAIYPFSLQDNSGNADFRTVSKSKVLIVINCFMAPFLLWSLLLSDYTCIYWILYCLL